MEGQLTRGETYSESNSTNMSANMISRTEGCCQLIKEEPITAKQQIAVWLTKTSTQILHQETDMSVMKNLINQKPNSSKHNTSPYCQPTTAWDESESSKEINRNANSKSRMGKSYPSSNYYVAEQEDEEGHGNEQIVHKNQIPNGLLNNMTLINRIMRNIQALTRNLPGIRLLGTIPGLKNF